MKNKILILTEYLFLLVFVFGLFPITPTAANMHAYYSLENQGFLQQDIEISGIVTDAETNDPLPGVNIVVEGTTQGTTTNMEGEYSIEAPPDATLIFSFVGYQRQIVEISGQQEINVNLSQDIAKLDEVVVVGYGTTSRSELTGSVSQVSSEDFERIPATNSLQSLEGRSPGMEITQNSGQPGAGVSIRIRGNQSIRGTNSPIFVVDGTITSSISDLNPSDIESVSVLKDASAVAIYGARAANGVIQITTKGGEANTEPTITFDTYQGIQQRSNLKVETLNSDEWLEIYTEAWRNAGSSIPWDDDDLADYEGVDTDWLDAVMETGYQSKYDLSVSGGSDNSQYFISTSYTDQKGMVMGQDYNRLNLRINTDHQIRDWIKFGNNLSIFTSSQNTASLAAHNQYTLAAAKVPITRIYEDDGSWGRIRNTALEHMHPNPIWIAENCLNNQDQKGIRGNVDLTLSLLKGLDFTARSSVEWTNDYRTNFDAGLPSGLGWEGSTKNQIEKDNREILHWVTDFLLNYDKSFGDDHEVSGLLGYSLEEQTYERLTGRRNATPTNEIQFLSAGDPTSMHNSNSYSDWAFASIFGRAEYSFKNKYIFSGSVRRDGSSRLEKNKYGLFPSLSAAWNLGREAFMDDLDWLNNLKMRASWGTVGNVMSIGTYGTKSSLYQWNYVLNQEPAQGFTLAQAVNQDLVWESTEKKNIGLDLNLFENKLYLISDFFIEDTKDLLFNQPIPNSTGLSGSPYVNAGQIRNTGVEFELGYKNSSGDWRYNFSVNMTHSKNEVIDLEGRDLRTEGIEEGYPLFSFFGYQSNGIIRTEEDLNNHPHYSGKQIGDIWLKDIDGYDEEGNRTGSPDGNIDAADRTLIPERFPDLEYGAMGTVGYKNFTLQVHLKGIQGRERDIRGGVNGGLMHYFTRWAMNHSDLVLDRFHPTKNPDGQYPRVSTDDSGNNTMFSDFWLRDASFLRINNVNLNYELPGSLNRRIGLGKLAAYVSVQNLYTFTDFPAPNVDSNTDDLTGIPQPRTWTVGMNVTF